MNAAIWVYAGGMTRARGWRLPNVLRAKSAHGRPTCSHRLYHLTCEEFGSIEKAAGGRCGICGQTTPRLTIDHDHGIGARAVRGMLCYRCNTLLRPVDAGRRSPTSEERAYLARPWFRRAGIEGSCPQWCDNNEHRMWDRMWARAAQRRGA